MSYARRSGHAQAADATERHPAPDQVTQFFGLESVLLEAPDGAKAIVTCPARRSYPGDRPGMTSGFS